MTPEGKVKALVKRRMAEAFPACYRFMPVQNGMGAPSLDMLYCVEGLFVAIETKAPGGKPTPRQLLTMQEMIRAGALVYTVDGEERLQAAIANIILALEFRGRHNARDRVEISQEVGGTSD